VALAGGGLATPILAVEGGRSHPRPLEVVWLSPKVPNPFFLFCFCFLFVCLFVFVFFFFFFFLGWFLGLLGWPDHPQGPGVAEATPYWPYGVAEATPRPLGVVRLPPKAQTHFFFLQFGGGRTTLLAMGVVRSPPMPKEPPLLLFLFFLFFYF
jgi:hypothetical protein